MTQEGAKMSGGGASKPMPMDGIRVLDLSRVLAGPWCTQMLADFGADVIKIERPGQGDDSRAWGPPFYESADGHERVSAYFCAANRGKRSVCLDLESEADRQALRELALRSDVLVENFKAGSLARHGLDYATLSALNPRLVYCSITGYGQTGPYAARPGYDSIIQAVGGMMSLTGLPDDAAGGGPQKTGIPIIDLMTGVYACCGVLMALREREASGQGQHLDLSLMDVQVSALSTLAANFLACGQAPQRNGNEHPTVVPGDAVQCLDGPLMLMVGNDRQFQRLCRHLDRESLARDPRYATNELRVQGKNALMAQLREAFRGQTRQYWLERLLAEGIPCGPIQTVAEVLADPHVRHRALVAAAPDPVFGEIRAMGSALRMSRTPARHGRAPTVLGEHTEAVLSSLASSRLQSNPQAK
ncbi:CaiB/BaiF CoA transferase family protein [Bordetella bronchiseptica]|uniref:CaiB/BaiF CoA transferase family protein n=1 Tax=Bordetella bronchiseptica TaxID=518 RepID=UPI0009B8F665|nr:CoA transferase [Bordetella bronchiseptica]